MEDTEKNEAEILCCSKTAYGTEYCGMKLRNSLLLFLLFSVPSVSPWCNSRRYHE
jgi:hypothetical protein